MQKVAVVTGAGTGIGKSAALALLEDGYCVGLVGRRRELLEKTADDSGARDRTLVLAADITQPANVKEWQGVSDKNSNESKLGTSEDAIDEQINAQHREEITDHRRQPYGRHHIRSPHPARRANEPGNQRPFAVITPVQVSRPIPVVGFIAGQAEFGR